MEIPEEVASLRNRNSFRLAYFALQRDTGADFNLPDIKHEAALCLGSSAEYRMHLAERLGVAPPHAVLDGMVQDLNHALILDDHIGDLHWDLAVIASRYDGDNQSAREHLQNALACQFEHPMVPALEERIQQQAPAIKPEPGLAYKLGELTLQLLDLAADDDLSENTLVLPGDKTRQAVINGEETTGEETTGEETTGEESKGQESNASPRSFDAFLKAAEDLIQHSPEPLRLVEIADYYARWCTLVDAGVVTADALDYGLEFVFYICKNPPKSPMAEASLARVLGYLRDMSLYYSGNPKPDPRNLKKARRVIRRAFRLLEATTVACSDDLRADLYLARGQCYSRPDHQNLARAFENYQQALRLKRQAKNRDDTRRLEQLLEQMLRYIIQQVSALKFGLGSSGKLHDDITAAYAAAVELGDTGWQLDTGSLYASYLADISSPSAAITVLDQLCALPGISAAKTTELTYEKAARLTEVRDSEAAVSLLESIREAIENTDPRFECLYWNCYSNALRELDRLQPALDAIDKAIELNPPVEDQQADPHLTMLHSNRAHILLRLDRLTEARAALEQAVAGAAYLTTETRLRTKVLDLRITLAECNYQQAAEVAAQAADALHEDITKGQAHPAVWQSMLFEWSRLDGLRLEACIKADYSAEHCLAIAEAAKGRLLRLYQLIMLSGGRELDNDKLTASLLTADTQMRLLEHTRKWIGSHEGRKVISFFCSSSGIALFTLGHEGVRQYWLEGSVYDRFRDGIFNHWEAMSDWQLNANLQRAAQQVGAPAELILNSAQALSELLLDWLGNLFYRACPELEKGGDELVIIPHRCFRSLPLANSRLPNGDCLSQLFSSVTLAHTLEMLNTGSSRESLTGQAVDQFLDPLGDLPLSRLEACSCKGNAQWMGTEANCERVREALAQSGALLLSTHSEFQARSPFDSWLAFSDGTITLAELVQHGRVHRHLVVLSSCESAQSQRSNSDEPFGFPAMLQAAGVTQVIAPAWRVDDLATFLLMSRFHPLVEAGIAAEIAIYQASHWLRQLTARQALEQLRELESSLSKNPGPFAGSLAMLDTQIKWLTTINGQSLPFASPVFWAAFQHYGAAPGWTKAQGDSHG